jgi:hypothetical protein
VQAIGTYCMQNWRHRSGKSYVVIPPLCLTLSV